MLVYSPAWQPNSNEDDITAHSLCDSSQSATFTLTLPAAPTPASPSVSSLHLTIATHLSASQADDVQEHSQFNLDVVAEAFSQAPGDTVEPTTCNARVNRYSDAQPLKKSHLLCTLILTPQEASRSISRPSNSSDLLIAGCRVTEHIENCMWVLGFFYTRPCPDHSWSPAPINASQAVSISTGLPAFPFYQPGASYGTIKQASNVDSTMVIMKIPQAPSRAIQLIPLAWQLSNLKKISFMARSHCNLSRPAINTAPMPREAPRSMLALSTSSDLPVVGCDIISPAASNVHISSL